VGAGKGKKLRIGSYKVIDGVGFFGLLARRVVSAEGSPSHPATQKGKNRSNAANKPFSPPSKNPISEGEAKPYYA
jgi:hypothetical protein